MRSVPADDWGWPLPLEAVTKHSAKSEGVIGPVALWGGVRCHLLNTLAQPKHDTCPHPLGPRGCRFWTKLFFQASLEPLGVGFLVFGCGWVREYGGKSSQFPVNGSSRSRILAYWHLPRPVIESTNTACTKFAARLPFQSDKQRHGRLMGAHAANVDQPVGVTRRNCVARDGDRAPVERRFRYGEASRRNWFCASTANFLVSSRAGISRPSAAACPHHNGEKSPD